MNQSQTVRKVRATPVHDFRTDVLAGLGGSPKSLPCKYFYDAAGTVLFDRICDLDAYYPTRTEIGILKQHAREMAWLIGPRARLVELGSGSSTKTRILLDELPDLDAYVPVDISPEYLVRAARELARDYPALRVVPVVADYTEPFDLPKGDRAARTVAFFPGSTIGNLEPDQARDFLRIVAGLCQGGGGLLIGVDLRKERSMLEAAYDDDEGVTAAFNLNLLTRINRELEGAFDLDAFRHRAFYDEEEGRIEMQLVSLRPQSVQVGTSVFRFDEGEPITTEYSYKYDPGRFAELAKSAGFTCVRIWTDERRLFSVQYFGVERRKKA
ncbi:MAG TPA: L-histidine N(alpha)-methyltransferase [Polyangiaceae bacterium]|jgi:dimethylhistidine N-methyltransferase|nr:L-histidine N(alpha)-methyltransferase [Polyangiaceae bacterium]